MHKLFFALCGLALVAVIRLLWGAWQAKRWGLKLLLLGLAAATLFLIVFVTLPSFVTARGSGSRNACMANLVEIQGAKEAWAREHKEDPADVPQPSDVIGPDKYLPALPICSLAQALAVNQGRKPPTPRRRLPSLLKGRARSLARSTRSGRAATSCWRRSAKQISSAGTRSSSRRRTPRWPRSGPRLSLKSRD